MQYFHIKREENFHANLLSKMARTKRKNHHHLLVIHQTIIVPSVILNIEYATILE